MSRKILLFIILFCAEEMSSQEFFVAEINHRLTNYSWKSTDCRVALKKSNYNSETKRKIEHKMIKEHRKNKLFQITMTTTYIAMNILFWGWVVSLF